MAKQALPMIPKKFMKPRGMVDLWDMDLRDPDENDKIIGPVKIERTAILAREALARDPERYKLELPKGMKPGPAQFAAEAEAEARAAEEEAEPPDPVFGKRSQQ